MRQLMAFVTSMHKELQEFKAVSTRAAPASLPAMPAKVKVSATAATTLPVRTGPQVLPVGTRPTPPNAPGSSLSYGSYSFTASCAPSDSDSHRDRSSDNGCQHECDDDRSESCDSSASSSYLEGSDDNHEQDERSHSDEHEFAEGSLSSRRNRSSRHSYSNDDDSDNSNHDEYDEGSDLEGSWE